MKKFLKFIGFGLLVCVLLLFLTLFFLPKLVNLQAIKARVEQEASQRLKAEVQIGELRLSLLPRPGLKLRRLNVKAPRYQLAVGEARLAFRLRPLFHKRLEIDSLVLDQPDLYVELRHKATPLSWRETLKKFLTYVPLMDLRARYGRLTLIRDGKLFFQVEKISLRSELRSDQILLECQGQNKAFHRLTITLKFWPQTDILEGQAVFDHLNLAFLPLSRSYPWLQDLKTDLSLEATYRREKNTWYIGFKGTAPCLLRKERPDLLFSCSAFLGEARLAPQKKWLKIHHILMTDPELDADAHLSWSPKEAFFYAKIKRGDFGLWRSRLLFLASKNRALARFFEILTAGELKQAEVEAHGNNLKELFHLENLTISGQAQGAEVVLPFLERPLKIQSGTFRLYHRVLFINQAQGSYKKAHLKNGRLELYIFDPNRPFLFEADLTAQAPEVLGVLKRLLKQEHFQKAFAKVRDLRGEASGHVHIRGSLKHPTVSFSIRPSNVFVSYQGFSFPLLFNQGEIAYDHRRLTFQGLTIRFPQSRLEGLSGALDLASHPFTLRLEEARGVLVVKELNRVLQDFAWFKGPDHLASGALYLKKALYQGPLEAKALEKGLIFEAQARDLQVNTQALPAPLYLQEGPLRYDQGDLSFGPLKVRLLDAEGILSGSVTPLLSPERDITLEGKANVGPEFLSWLYRRSRIPPELYPLPPLQASELEVHLGRHVFLRTHFRTGKGARINLELQKTPSALQISSAKVEVGGRSLVLTLSLYPKKVYFQVEGALAKKDWFAIFKQPRFVPSRLKARARGCYSIQDPVSSCFRGEIALSGLKFSYQGQPVFLKQVLVKGQGRRGSFKELKIFVGGSLFTYSGRWELAPKNLRLTGTVQTAQVDLDDLLQKFFKDFANPRSQKRLPLVLDLNLRVNRLQWHQYQFSKLKGSLIHFEKRWQVVLEEAHFCGITLMGGIDWTPERPLLRVSYYSRHSDLQKLLTCVLGDDLLAKGPFVLEGTFQGQGKQPLFLQNTSGKFSLSSPKGRVYKLGIMVKLFAFLNPLEVFSGKLPDLSREGLGYDLLEIKGHFQEHYLIIDTAQLRGKGLRIFASGKVDLQRQKVYLTALIAPFVQIDALVSRIPVVGWVLTGKSKTFFSIPVSIRGSLKSPDIIPLDPRAVSKTLLGILGRTLQLPVKLFIPQATPPSKPNKLPAKKVRPSGK